MSFADMALRKFAAHETFALRFGWLRKAYTAVESGGEGPDHRLSGAFLAPDAPVQLGVGKNMVNAIRYWAQAFGITEEERLTGTSRALYARPTDRARWMLAEDGVDPWLEQPGSLWLLHWWLLRQRCLAPTWWVAFYSCPTRFHEDELLRLVEAAIDAGGWEPVSRSSIAKDIDCLTKMYAPRRSAKGSPGSVEDLIDSPFRELGILDAVPGQPKRWEFASRPQVAAPAEVVAYACLDYMALHKTGEMSTARLAQEQGAVGRALRLTEPALVDKLVQVCPDVPGMAVIDSLGQRALTVQGDAIEMSDSVINGYYDRDRTNASSQLRKGA